MDLTETARLTFADDHYATSLTGIVIEHVGNHKAECSLALDNRHRNARGAAMGGVLFTLADFAAAIAANSECLGSGELRWVSLNASIHYLSPALGRSLSVRCTSVKHGRTTALYRSEITDHDSSRLVAVAETTMMQV